MDVPEAAVPADSFSSPPPSYAEATQSPEPSTPPPTYGEAVGDPRLRLSDAATPYPILSIPTADTPVRHTQRVSVQPSARSVTPRQQQQQWQQQQQEQLVGTLGDAPTVVNCPHCHRQITTSVLYKPGNAAWGMCCVLTVLGLICGFCLIPCCMREFQDAHHSCPACKKFLGIHVR